MALLSVEMAAECLASGTLTASTAHPNSNGSKHVTITGTDAESQYLIGNELGRGAYGVV